MHMLLQSDEMTINARGTAVLLLPVGLRNFSAICMMRLGLSSEKGVCRVPPHMTLGDDGAAQGAAIRSFRWEITVKLIDCFLLDF